MSLYDRVTLTEAKLSKPKLISMAADLIDQGHDLPLTSDNPYHSYYQSLVGALRDRLANVGQPRQRWMGYGYKEVTSTRESVLKGTAAPGSSFNGIGKKIQHWRDIVALIQQHAGLPAIDSKNPLPPLRIFIGGTHNSWGFKPDKALALLQAVVKGHPYEPGKYGGRRRARLPVHNRLPTLVLIRPFTKPSISLPYIKEPSEADWARDSIGIVKRAIAKYGK